MAFGDWLNLPAVLEKTAARLGDQPFLWAKEGGTYRSRSWREVRDEVARLGRGLRALGIGPGDRVVLVSDNRPEWLIADHAIMACGAITVPAYTTNTVENHRYILRNSGASAVILENARLGRTLLPAALTAPGVRHVIGMEPLGIDQQVGPEILTWGEVLDRGDRQPDDHAERVARIARNDTACIIHTSGTGGAPKGVMLSHGAIISNCVGAYGLFSRDIELDREVFLSFLPLSHAYEHTAGQFLPVAIGAQIYYAEGVETLSTNMQEARPTIMTAVPRLYETIMQRVRMGVRRQGGYKERLFELTVALGSRRYEDPGSLGLGERLLDALCERLVRAKVRERFGGRLRFFVSGGAPLNYDVGLFFTALGVRLLQGYGQTEAAPVVSCNPFGRIKLHTVGPPLEGVEVRIADDGEILIRGELVMQGYWNDAEATAATIRDGWLHTGDVGRIDEDGYIQITDRKKDLIVNSGGDNVSPQRVEGFLTLQPEIAQAMVFGDRRPYLVALVVPEPELLERWSDAVPTGGGDGPALIEHEGLRGEIGAAVERVNRTLSAIEKIRRFVVAPAAFSVDNHMLTPTLKIRRHVIREKYGEALESLYRG